MPPKANGQDLDDPSLLDDENDDPVTGADDDLGGDGARDGGEPKDNGGAQDGGDDIDVVVEEETEGDTEANADAGALDAGDRRGADDDLTDASRNVRERIERERRIAREANARAQAAHQARLTAEARARTREKEALDVTETALESNLKHTRAALLKAKEDGKSEDEIKLQEELDRLNRRKDTITQLKGDLERQEEEAKRGASDAQANPLADQWKARNRWFNDPRFKEQSAITIVIDRAMANEGYDKNSAEYYQELDRRVRRRLPELQRYMQRPAAPDGAQGGGKPRREPTGGVQRRDAGGGQGGGAKRKVTLNKQDFSNMRNFGLDPSNKEHQREYALNKVRSN